MYKILLPTDFSDIAQNAIEYAVYLFEREPCTFYLFHAYYIVPSETGTKLDAGNALELLQERLEATKNAKHTFENVLLSDTALGGIEKTIAEKNIDYVFMGTKGSSALKEIFMGSVTTSVIKYIDNCPIIAVPGEYDYDIPDDILFANDFKHAFTSFELTPLIKLASLWGSIINIVYINSTNQLEDFQKLNKELLQNHLKDTRHRFIQVKKKNSVSATLKDLEKQYENIGMVTFLKTKHSFFEKLVREPIIKNMTFMTHIPLLVLPENQ